MTLRLVFGLVGLMLAVGVDAAERCPATSSGLASRCVEGGGAVLPASVYVGVAELERRLRAGERMHLIDLRPEDVAMRDPMPIAIALSPTQLKAKRIWQREPILLLGSGAAYSAALRLRDELTDLGFDRVSVLDGGARFWRANVERHRHSGHETLVPPAAIDLVGDADRWTILEIGVQSPRPLPGIQRIGVALETAERVAQAALASLPRGRGAVPNVLVVGPDDALASAVAARLQERARGNVFALQGGWGAWEEQQAAQDRLVAAATGERRAHAVGSCW